MMMYQKNNVTVFQSALFQLNSTIVVTDDIVLVTDPGYLPQEIEVQKKFVENIKGDRPVYLFFTHSDFDHIVGYGAFPGAKTIASKEFVESPLKEAQLHDVIKFDDEFYITRPYEVEYPKIDCVIRKDGEKLIVGKTEITFYHGLGHNHDGLIAVVESLDLVIAGDYLSDVEFPFVYYSYAEYEKTLDTFKKLLSEERPLTLITSHGNVTEDQQEIQKRINDSEEYLTLVENGGSSEEFQQFLNAKGYRFLTNLKARHEDNLRVKVSGTM
ncbi:MBL fold metallo-hydrolase [Bacillus sp. BRMEA1]|uniref:MBL fold metallo-hydrolase n=1 Tax=Neobacillus endophyticus TaxID=2738405 RepID=UPI0015655456|nr:MBL fold metallo-hydrolase [Neobacillus endophyticus]NRD79458.1 MBL fold metallo-hydrolase [Neobacillus endophyticus]